MTRTASPHRPTARGTSPDGLIDPQTLMRIKGLELRAKVVVEGLLRGLHKSPFHGFSVEFTDYREYTPGDDLRHLDWRLYARTDRYYIKRFEDETNLRCHLLVDTSRSMGYGSGDYTKARYATTLAATLAYFLTTQRDAVGLITFAEQIGETLPPRYRPGHLRRLMLALERPVAGKATDLGAPLRRVAEMVTRRGVIVLVSDLLAPIDALESNLAGLRSRGHDVVVFQVLDPAEIRFGFERAVLFQDMESERDLYVDPAAVRETYLRRFAAHNAAIRTACDNLGIEYHQLATDEPLELALFDFLRGRMRRGRRTQRTGRYTSRRQT